jgi:beta-phosphoglucomutase-like phosphatase (HAD superfamily)
MNEAPREHGQLGARTAGSARVTQSREPASGLSDHRALLDGIGAVVFDFDGTLADTTPSHEQALRAALQPHGLDLDPGWYLRHAGLSIRDLLAQLPGARHLPHDEIIQDSRAGLLATIGCLTPIGGVVALLRAARRAGLPCAVASGASRLLVQPGLEALGLANEFAVVVTAEDAPRGKPAPTCTSRRPAGLMYHPAAASPSTTHPTA